MKRIVTLITFALLFSFFGMAQEKKGLSYSGVVCDTKGAPIEYATVVLLKNENQVGGTITDENGLFKQMLASGTYQVVVQYLGYETLKKKIDLHQSTEDTLVLKDLNVALGEVVVKARQIERKADRFVVMVPPSLSKDGAQLISESPGVWLSDKDISINGASGTKVYINNKEVKLEGEQLVNYIRSIRSDNIKKIEVIPVAGAEYDADTKGGVIIITLRNRMDNGVNGTITMGSTVGKEYQKYQPSATLNAHIGKWDLNAMTTLEFNPKNHRLMDAYRLYPDNSTDFYSHSRYQIHGNYGMARLGALYEIDSIRTIGAEYEHIEQSSDNKSYSTTDITQTTVPIHTTGIYNEHSPYSINSATMNYIQKTDPYGSELKAITTYIHKHSTGRNNYETNWTFPSYSKDSLYRNHSGISYDIATAELSMNQVLSRHSMLKAGAKYTYTLMDDHSEYEGFSSNNSWNTIPNYGYKMRYNENIAAAYASYSMEKGPFSLIAGLRTEYTRTSNKTDHINKNYFDFFPNVTLNYAFDPIKKWILIGQYSRSIERPAFYTLNPNRIQISDYSYDIGNPKLRPTYIDNIQLTLVYNYRYTLTVGTHLHHDLIREYAYKDSQNPEVYYVTYENHNRENHTFVALTAPLQPFPWFKLTVNCIEVLQQIKMTEQSDYKNHFLQFYVVNAAFTLSPNSTIEAIYNGTSKLYSGNSGIYPRHTFDLTWRQKFGGNRWVLSAGVNNIFNHNYNYFSKLDDYQYVNHYNAPDAGRVFKISLTWNFNSGKKVKAHSLERGTDSVMERLNENKSK